MATPHSDLVKLAMLALQQELGPAAIVVRQETGLAQWGAGQATKYGVTGSCDIRGYRADGTPFEVEVKIGRDRLREGQETWRTRLQAAHVAWFLCRSAGKGEEDLHAATEALRGLVRDWAAGATPAPSAPAPVPARAAAPRKRAPAVA